MNLVQKGSNQTELKLNDYIVFFSYQTPVAAIDRCNGQAYVTDKKWSKTTSRHINAWLGQLPNPKDYKMCDQEFLDNLLNEEK